MEQNIIDLIPITKLKKSKNDWLNTPIKYDDELKIKDLINEMCYKSYSWIESKDDLELVTDYDSFKNDFINLIYDKYLK
tara:strand:+ start:1863 stop:2099 length:237 start_codon:yes stop_codon:yes gene_type:complete